MGCRGGGSSYRTRPLWLRTEGFCAQVRPAGSIPPQVLIGAHWSPQLLIEIPQRIVITPCAEAWGTADHSKTVKALIKLFLIIALYLKKKD